MTPTVWRPPALIVPPAQSPLNPDGYEMLLIVSVELPLLVIVNGLTVTVATGVLPNARLPASPMTRVLSPASTTKRVPEAGDPFGRPPYDDVVPYSFPSVPWIKGAVGRKPVLCIAKSMDWSNVPFVEIVYTLPAAVDPLLMLV